MKVETRIMGALLFAAGSLIFCASSSSIDGLDQNKIKLNESALGHARQLIAQGRVVVDKRNGWGEHQPSAEEENEFIRQRGFEEYAKWHLGIDERHAENTKARYKFLYGDFNNVHRCALLAARTRAAQYQHYDIENAAFSLSEIIGRSSPAGPRP